MFPQEIIRKKRDKGVLSKEEISFFIKGTVNGSIADCQIGAFTMAAFLNSLTKQEIIDLTVAMRDSGDVMHWKLDAPIIDKHSTGGVGDKISLMLAPILACFPAYVPMIAGRGLGHTGGTLDKLDSIPGYQTIVPVEKFRETVEKVRCAIVGQSANLAPADKKIYAIRDVSATVESIPLITASILSKKLAAGLEYLVMDLKCGNGAFMSTKAEAEKLARTIVDTANGAGTKTTAILTDMNSVLGTTVGNALEVREVLAYLRNEKRDNRVDIITKALASELLLCAKIVPDLKTAEEKIEQKIVSGEALEKFAQMVYALGGPVDFCEREDNYLPKAPIIKPVFIGREGYIDAMDTMRIGMSLIALKGGRTNPEQKINHATGYTDFCPVGSFVDNNTPVAFIHAQNYAECSQAEKMLLQSLHISQEKPKVKSPIFEKIS